MYSFIVIIILTILFILTAVIEYRQHQKTIYRIPIRIHVNGTRGKSSVARLIGAGLAEGGVRTITKITGTFPRLIIDDGREVHIYRKAGANIIEQLSIAKYAASRKVRALVIECMALDPKNQKMSEQQMIHSTIGVMTNVRLDHTDIMGKTIEEIAKTMGLTIPHNGVLFSSDKENSRLLFKLCDQKKTKCYISDGNTITEDELNRFTYIEHAENIALALDVCRYAGVKRHIALHGMYKVLPDPGALKRFISHEGGKELIFYNAFAANDPHSSLMIWRKLQAENKLIGTTFIILNSRAEFIYATPLDSSITKRLSIYKQRSNNIKAYINIGGGIANLGSSVNYRMIPNGLTKNLDVSYYNDKGVIIEMAKQKIPVIQLLNVTTLAEQYKLPDNPVPLPVPGQGDLFYSEKYDVALTAGIMVILSLLITIIYILDKRRHRLGTEFIAASLPAPKPKKDVEIEAFM